MHSIFILNLSPSASTDIWGGRSLSKLTAASTHKYRYLRTKQQEQATCCLPSLSRVTSGISVLLHLTLYPDMPAFEVVHARVPHTLFLVLFKRQLWLAATSKGCIKGCQKFGTLETGAPQGSTTCVTKALRRIYFFIYLCKSNGWQTGDFSLEFFKLYSMKPA